MELLTDFPDVCQQTFIREDDGRDHVNTDGGANSAYKRSREQNCGVLFFCRYRGVTLSFLTLLRTKHLKQLVFLLLRAVRALSQQMGETLAFEWQLWPNGPLASTGRRVLHSTILDGARIHNRSLVLSVLNGFDRAIRLRADCLSDQYLHKHPRRLLK